MFMNGYDRYKDGLILTASWLFFFTSGKLPPCHHTSIFQISSITIHPSEPSAPAAITQYLSGAEDKLALCATSYHIMPLNYPSADLLYSCWVVVMSK